jgi:glutamyl/glutaminyl-tRNA synthetase
LHLGHARTFGTAALRTRQHQGTLLLRNEDLDPQRSRPEFVQAMLEDLRWLGFEWSEGPDCGGRFAPYSQSQRRAHYFSAWQRLWQSGFIYPCVCSRRELALVATAPNEVDDEPLYPGTCRVKLDTSTHFNKPAGVNWRMRVPDGVSVEFDDLHLGPQRFVAGRDFGDFVIWRRDDVPAYQLAVVVDDAQMGITEVVRGADLLKSTARQILLYRALQWTVPAFFHCDLILDELGQRLAKRNDALSIRHLRQLGWTPEQVLRGAVERLPSVK